MRHASLFIASFGLLLAGCASEEARIKKEIAAANYCETKDDCVLVGSKCPFDCYIYANTAEADRIRAMVDAYETQCTYSCLASQGVDCVNNKCVTITENPGQSE